MTKTADLYIRVSTDEQADKGYSQRNQEEMLLRYCDFNGIAVRKVVFEDHSAKTFERPEWKQMIAEYKKKSHCVDLLLFTKWDRFSRNAPEAYNMISLLRRLDIEPCAIDQPLDLSIPENKMMLAIYLTSGEVENDRRSLNVIGGMRRAMKEGRYMGLAPVGYINRVKEDGTKYIAPKPKQAEIMKWAFDKLEEGHVNTEQIYWEAKRKGLECTKNTFWNAIRNPVYCGKIFIPAYKGEDSMLIAGLHEPLISEATFYNIQEILDGRKRIKAKEYATKIFAGVELPLRGFIKCPKCSRTLTGSTSKGRHQYYNYYHCTSKCGFRVRAEVANDLFEKELRKYIPRPEVATLYKTVVKDVSDRQNDSVHLEKTRVLRQVEEQTNRINKARELLLKGDLDALDYKQIKSSGEETINKLEAKITQYSSSIDRIEPLLDKAINALSSLGKLYRHVNVKRKREIIGSIFKEKPVFTGDGYRTGKTNEVAGVIFLVNKELDVKTKRTSLENSSLSYQVAGTGLEPVAFGL
ncbi:recombinase family protein [Parapedobacter sp. ISTM3]|uniref:recombinase family protein n=1 Tax=Parapedobacter sp. ISTM3 TaxID=2800130 RepID=UPI0019073B9F|nr:recombinase family protein [Parapedobacter sp. ISTM3]MBK1439780.1 recombinase family protein [Parapedobacter sp. ISTM3]